MLYDPQHVFVMLIINGTYGNHYLPSSCMPQDEKRKHSLTTSVNYNLFHCNIHIFWNVVCMNRVSLPTSKEHSTFIFRV